MFLSKLEKTFILNLKGRVSKILNCSSKLKKEERENLESVYKAIDDLILYKGIKSADARENFQCTLRGVTLVLGKTNKKYVREHILPLINKISNNKWSEE